MFVLERRVSVCIREQPFLRVNPDDEPSTDNDRVGLERNAIVRLSNAEKHPINSRRDYWPGRCSQSGATRGSGFQNVDDVDERNDNGSLGVLQRAAVETPPLWLTAEGRSRRSRSNSYPR